jgi:hypothetical protein
MFVLYNEGDFFDNKFIIIILILLMDLQNPLIKKTYKKL